MDDDLLLNFAAPSTAAPTKSKNSASKVSGGRWKDRRKLQLSLQGRGRNTKNKSVTGVNAKSIEGSRINRSSDDKKPSKESSKLPDVSRGTDGPSVKRSKFSERSGESGGNNASYVSSLFTSNKEVQSVASSQPQVDHSASNAPLRDATSFSGLGLNEKLSKHLTETLRFKHPTKVQQSVLPSLLHAQRDLFVKAQTGSGKTLSFLLPIFNMLASENINRDLGLFAIILTPTRELATQIYGVMETLMRCHHNIVPGIVIGGEKKKSEKARLRKGVNILVATPGRLADHMENTTSLDVSLLRWLILDEGDKLVELGFEETITKITDMITKNSRVLDTMHKWKNLPTKRVNVLCSATIQDSVQKLGSIILNNPEMINVDSKEGAIDFHEKIESKEMTAPDQLVQNIVVVPPKLRLVTLSGLVKASGNEQNEENKTIVFFSCSDSVEFHFDVFTRNGNKFKKIKNSETEKFEIIEVPNDNDDDEDDLENKTEGQCVLTAPLLGENYIIYKLHGSLSQQARTSTLNAFIKCPESKRAILLCTDVASRGLDMPNISNVIEYDPPFTIEDHLHRVGRSARVGKRGTATLFLLPGEEEGYVDGKLKVVHPKQGSLRIIKYEDILKKGFGDSLSISDKSDPKSKEGKWDIHATTWHLDIERWLLEDSSAHDLAVQAFTSHIRAYATHLSSERAFFNVKLLHLGHLAKCFGLRETPKKLGKSVGSINEIGSRKPKKENSKNKMFRMARQAVKSASDEFNY